MKKSKSLFEALTALKAVTQTLFKKMPVLFLVVVYLIDLGIRSYLSAASTPFPARSTVTLSL